MLLPPDTVSECSFSAPSLPWTRAAFLPFLGAASFFLFADSRWGEAATRYADAIFASLYMQKTKFWSWKKFNVSDVSAVTCWELCGSLAAAVCKGMAAGDSTEEVATETHLISITHYCHYYHNYYCHYHYNLRPLKLYYHLFWNNLYIYPPYLLLYGPSPLFFSSVQSCMWTRERKRIVHVLKVDETVLPLLLSWYRSQPQDSLQAHRKCPEWGIRIRIQAQAITTYSFLKKKKKRKRIS